MYIGRFQAKAAASWLNLSHFPVSLAVNWRQNAGSIALLLFPIQGKEGDTDDSSALDEIIKLDAVLCFTVLL